MRPIGHSPSATVARQAPSLSSSTAQAGDMNKPASSLNEWLNGWLIERFPQDFIPASSAIAASDYETRFPKPAHPQRTTSAPGPNQTGLKEKVTASNVTLVADNDKKIARLETLLNRINHKLGRPLLENIRVIVDNSMGFIGQRNGAGNQAAYQNTRDASSGKIYQESLHINSQFLDYLTRQPISKAEAYLAAVLFHEQSHRDVLMAAESKKTFHRISQADERNANERSEAAIAQHYPEYYSWLRQNYFDLFRTHFSEAYGSLPVATDQDWHLIHSGNNSYNQRYFPY